MLTITPSFSCIFGITATGEALAASTNIPSLAASLFLDSRISASLTVRAKPFDSLIAFIAFFHETGLPILIADALVSGSFHTLGCHNLSGEPQQSVLPLQPAHLPYEAIFLLFPIP